jgi:hypothetical protein
VPVAVPPDDGEPDEPVDVDAVVDPSPAGDHPAEHASALPRLRCNQLEE